MVVRSHLLRTTNACLELDLYGEAGRALVLLPGAGGGLLRFRDIGNELADIGYKLAAMNYRGAGKSTGVLDPLTMHDLASDVAAVIEYLGAPATLLGNTFGNRVARCTAGDFPGLVEKLILVSAGGQVAPDPEVLKRWWQMFDPTLSDEVRMAAARDTLFSPENEVPGWWFQDNRSQVAADSAVLALKSTPPDDWQAGGDKHILVIQGADDVIAVPENAEALRRSWPDRVVVEIVENAGHAVLNERPRQVADIIKNYLGWAFDPFRERLNRPSNSRNESL